MKTRIILSTAAAALLAISGCGGGGSGDNDNSSGTEAGRVADGYISGAYVCHDTDGDMDCLDETYAVTTAAGGFILPGYDPAQTLLVQIPAGAVDNGPFADGSTTPRPVMTAMWFYLPGGVNSVFASPYSTLIYQLMQDHPGWSIQDAETYLKNLLGLNHIPGSLFEDYLSGPGANSELQRLAETLFSILEGSMANADPADSPQQQMHSAIEAAMQPHDPCLPDQIVYVGRCAYDKDHDGYPAPEDCNDFLTDVSPAAVEIPGDGIDNDCDGLIDNNTTTADTDGNETNMTQPASCEIPGDGTDNDGDGLVDEADGCISTGVACTSDADCAAGACMDDGSGALSCMVPQTGGIDPDSCGGGYCGTGETCLNGSCVIVSGGGSSSQSPYGGTGQTGTGTDYSSVSSMGSFNSDSSSSIAPVGSGTQTGTGIGTQSSSSSLDPGGYDPADTSGGSSSSIAPVGTGTQTGTGIGTQSSSSSLDPGGYGTTDPASSAAASSSGIASSVAQQQR